MASLTVNSCDGATLAVQQWGEGDLELLFIHGFNQCHLAWMKQVNDPALRAACRMVTFDLRGHGGSAKPAQADAYADGALWAADMAAVMEATALKSPVVVGWSYAGRVITDYIRTQGCGRLAGINFVGALLKADGKMMGHGRRHFAPMVGEDLAGNIAGTRDFLRACFAAEPPRDDFEIMLAYNMVMPPIVRRHVLNRTTDPAEVLGAIPVPVLLTHGEKDQVILPVTARYAATQLPNAQLSLYDNAGHSPFYEEPARFNAELLGFARACKQT